MSHIVETFRSFSLAGPSGSLRFLGSRISGRKVRADLETALDTPGTIEIDLGGIGISQSFADELIGVLLLERTPSVLERVVFKGCSAAARATIEFVVADRFDQFVRTKSH